MKGAEGFYGQKDVMNVLIDHLVLCYCHSLTWPEPTCQMGILIVNESHPYGRCLVDGQKTDSGGRMGYNVTLQLSGTQRLTQNVLLDIN